MTNNTSNAFVDRLAEMRTAERELTAALPLVEAAASSSDLRNLLHIHWNETRGHVRALDDIARHLDCDLPTRPCPPVTALIGEAVKVIGNRVISSEQDAALIGVGRKIEQFEMNAYQELCAAARQQGLPHEVAILTSILNQETMANELLGELGAGHGPLKQLVETASLRRAVSAGSA